MKPPEKPTSSGSRSPEHLKGAGEDAIAQESHTCLPRTGAHGQGVSNDDLERHLVSRGLCLGVFVLHTLLRYASQKVTQ